MIWENETINIAFVSDADYAIPTGVAVYTLLENRNPERKYHIYVIAKALASRQADLIRSISTSGFKITILDAERITSYDGFEKMEYAMHVTPASLYKFNLPDALSSIDKLLYLDGDIIIRDSLEELYDTDISGCYAAVCRDIGAESYPAPYNERLGINHSGYFNSGVMLLNLSLLRRDGIPKKLLDYKINGKNDYMDQDAFNVVFAERVKYISFLYNMGFSCWRGLPAQKLCEYYGLPPTTAEELYANAKILHLSAPEKPWLYYDVPASEEWLCAFARSPLSAIELHRKSNPRGMEKLTNGCDYESLRYIGRLDFDTDSPKISVITPVYNAERFLPLAIESLICQTFKSCEFIFVDDGSTDSSREILEKYRKIDSRIRIFYQENSRAGIARNNGISKARGKYITFLDSDDIMIPDALNEFFWRAEHTGADIVISSAYHFEHDAKKRVVADWCLREKYLSRESGISIKNHAKYIFQISGGAPWGKFFRRDLIRENGLRFPAAPRAEDIYFVYWAFAVAKSISILKRKTVLYRNDSDSASLENSKDKHPTAQIEVRRDLAEKLREIGAWDTVKQSFINNVINGDAYHLRTFKTAEAFGLVYGIFKSMTVPYYEIDMQRADYFYSPGEYEYMKEIYNSESYESYIFNKMLVYKKQADRHWRELKILRGKHSLKASEDDTRDLAEIYLAEIKNIKSSYSYRIGRALTWLPRQIRAAVKCYLEHGLKYTARRVLVKLRFIKDFQEN